MTYFGFLLRFLVIPILLLGSLAWYDQKHGRQLPPALRNWMPWKAIGLHMAIALLYTTPWDNYLVATRVWWYDPELVTGIIFGWVPLEEYTFFLLQPLLAGLWTLVLARRLLAHHLTAAAPQRPLRSYARWLATLVIGLAWLASVALLLSGWQPGTYLALALGWALPPIALQLAFGADILWRYRRLVFLSIVPMTLYLSAADALAISFGTWTINPAQSLNIFLGGGLPIEEFLFFLLTNVLLVFGIVLVLARESEARFLQVKEVNLPLQRMMSSEPVE